MTFQKRAKTIVTEKVSGVTRGWGLREALITEGHEGPLGAAKPKSDFGTSYMTLFLPKFTELCICKR